MGNLVLQDLSDVLAAVLEDELAATRVAVKEVCDIVDLGTQRNVAGLLIVVRLHIRSRDGRKGAAGHRRGGRHAVEILKCRQSRKRELGGLL